MKKDNFVVHVVDPDQAIADGLATLLSTYGIQVVAYPDAESFLHQWEPEHPCHCCLLVEAELPGLSGPALLQKACTTCRDLSALIFVSAPSPELIEAANQSSHIGVIEKPCVNGTLIRHVLRLQRHH